jgi:type IV pilus assembly protein PilA
MPGLFGHSWLTLMSAEFDEFVILFSRIRNGPGTSFPAYPILEKPTMNNKKGFTLIELLIVVVIIGILAAIAIPKFANTKDKAYVAAMKSDLRNLATYEEQYAADQNGAYFAGVATTAAPLNGFTPSQNVTITAVIVAGPPQSWTASATHSQSAKVCDNSTGAIVCT